LAADQVGHVRSAMDHGLGISTIGRRAAAREWHFSSASPWVAGISPGKDGAYSVCPSGRYEDGIDESYALSVLFLSVIFLHLTRTNPQHSVPHQSGRKGHKRNQN